MGILLKPGNAPETAHLCKNLVLVFFVVVVVIFFVLRDCEAHICSEAALKKKKKTLILNCTLLQSYLFRTHYLFNLNNVFVLGYI